MSLLPPSTTPAKILIVDDEPINIKVLNAVLGEEYEIMVATSGEQALELAESARPDLILLDILMPGMDGHEVCRRLKSLPEANRIPVIFITAMSSSMDETKGFDLGAVDYVAKPFNPSVVKARVKTHVRLALQTNLLEKLASLDGLTGIPNRRAFDKMLERERGRSQRSGTDCAVAMVDVDMFKQYNDQYGHAAGDDCLVLVARALAGCLRRPEDFVARYGGEEFAAVLPNSTPEGAMKIAEDFRAAVAALNLAHLTSGVAAHVTVSVGIATGGVIAGSGLGEICAAADKMLYAAKEGGRNQVRFIHL